MQKHKIETIKAIRSHYGKTLEIVHTYTACIMLNQTANQKKGEPFNGL